MDYSTLYLQLKNYADLCQTKEGDRGYLIWMPFDGNAYSIATSSTAEHQETFIGEGSTKKDRQILNHVGSTPLLGLTPYHNSGSAKLNPEQLKELALMRDMTDDDISNILLISENEIVLASPSPKDKSLELIEGKQLPKSIIRRIASQKDVLSDFLLN